VLGNVRVVVDVEDPGQPSVRSALDDELRVQDPLRGLAAAVQLGADRVDQERRVRGDDLDDRGLGVYVTDADQRLAVAAGGAELQVLLGDPLQRRLVVTAQLTGGVGEIAAGERVGVRPGRQVDTRAGVGHCWSPRCDMQWGFPPHPCTSP
jgi:hypothetical protein